MCGIYGQYDFNGSERVSTETLRTMTKTMVHRGPDDEGYYSGNGIGFGFRRLSIIDLAGGHQPMSDETESVWVVFNGEIYNYRELRQELQADGFRFRTESDTEVIVHGYRKWGLDVLDHLNGMFGLAVWDLHRRRLMVARDRLGVKLVYYRLDGESVAFGSEIRPLLAGGRPAPAVDPAALYLFLRYRYTPSPLTMFEGIRKLAPGTRMIVDEGRARIERWWNYEPEPFDPAPEPEEAGEEVLALYRRAVKRQLVSDVPLGLLLSGGLDSSLLLALMNLSGRQWQTFTVGYGTSFADDELADAEATAKALGARHHPVRITREVFEETLPRIVAALEEPIASSSIVPMYHVCARAREEVKVALIGQGPDELFGGYRRHWGVRYGHYWRMLPRWARKGVGGVLGAVQRWESVRRGLYALGEPHRGRRYQKVLSIEPHDRMSRLFRDGLLPADIDDRLWECWGDLGRSVDRLDELGGLQFLEVRSTLPDELLMYADKLSMAHSLELRVPYLDHEIVEYVERLPASYKVGGGEQKRLHRRVCRKFLPPEVLRRKKRGFAVNVVDGWFHESLAGRFDGYLKSGDSRIYDFVEPKEVLSLLAEHKAGKEDHHKILFSLVAFEEWLKIFT